jgi:hypothetical protein
MKGKEVFLPKKMDLLELMWFVSDAVANCSTNCGFEDWNDHQQLTMIVL